jgi:hypothetical protein
LNQPLLNVLLLVIRELPRTAHTGARPTHRLAIGRAGIRTALTRPALPQARLPVTGLAGASLVGPRLATRPPQQLAQNRLDVLNQLTELALTRG